MKRFFPRQISYAAIIFIFLLLLNFFWKDYIFDFSSRKEKIIKKTEKEIQRKEKIADQILGKIISDSTSDLQGKLFSDEKILKTAEDEKIAFLIYQNDSLIFWTKNTFFSPEIFNEKLPARRSIKTDNGWYYLIRETTTQKTCFAAVLLKNEYKYENKYLKNVFTGDFQTTLEGIGISENTGQNFIKNTQGKKLCSLTFEEKETYSSADQNTILLIYFFTALTFLYLLYQIYRSVCKNKPDRKHFCILAFCFTLILLRTFFFLFKFPAIVYSTDFFGPLFYASSGFLPSFGDLLTNTILFFILVLFLYKNKPDQSFHIKNKTVRYIVSALIITALAALFLFIISLIQSIIQDSTISFNLSQLFTIDTLSVIGLVIISLLILSWIILAIVLLGLCFSFNLSIYYIFPIIVLNGFVWSVKNVFGLNGCLPATLGFVVFTAIYFLIRRKRERFHYYEIMVYLILFTGIVYYTFTVSNIYKEVEKRKSLAHKLSSGEDPLAENFFKDIQKQILDDKLLMKKLSEYPQSESDIKDYLTKKYFTGYWDKYKVQITVCNPLDSLLVEAGPQKENCRLFFEDLLKAYGKPASCPNLYALNYGTGGNNYLSKLDFNIDSSRIFLFVELNSKFIPKGLGYPELLIDKKLFLDTDLSNYSYAKYYRNNLIDAYGKYYYSTNYSIDESLFVNGFYHFRNNGYNHLCYKPDASSMVLVSKKNGNILDILAPFSILFTLFSLVLLVFYLFDVIIPGRKTIRFDFKNRLQVSMVSIILISFLIIGVSTFYFIRNLNENKNLDLLSEKTMSVLIELQNKISDTEIINNEQLTVLNNALAKFSNVFFTDINVYDTKGRLISSSRPQIFYEGLLSDRMEPTAYYQLFTQKKTLFIHKENIGELHYYSAYVPFYGRNNKILYYINLPYFAKEGELKTELSSFLTAFINIYLILIAVTVLIALFIAGRMSQPLNVIREKLGNLKLGKRNEKIVWTKRDEIGELISEYNRMLDELSESAEILSRSERESAWRVMAMQVAHEIKNPLTPMKLSVQHLERSWKDKAPDWDVRLERFTKNIIEQIENLSAIASEFSYFAKMPKPQNEKINLVELVVDSVSIFMSNRNIKISIEKEKAPEEVWVVADKKQLIRVMNNILTNAIQAIGSMENGLIRIGINKKETTAVIHINDNGSGISEEMKSKIFTPNFSTKSEGMGLGLAIVKGIVENFGGTITFKSEIESGTTFYIELPLYE